jgi:tRNA(adenine34) deaminase
MKHKTDIEKMQVALEEAKKALTLDEVPIGAAIFDKNDNLISSAHNMREVNQNPILHAEIIVIQEASKIFKTWRLEDTTIAVTVEPDAMCAGAIVNARIKTLLYGLPNLKAGAAYSLYNIPQDPRLNHFVEIRENILPHESEVILSSFFESKR